MLVTWDLEADTEDRNAGSTFYWSKRHGPGPFHVLGIDEENFVRIDYAGYGHGGFYAWQLKPFFTLLPMPIKRFTI